MFACRCETASLSSYCIVYNTRLGPYAFNYIGKKHCF